MPTKMLAAISAMAMASTAVPTLAQTASGGSVAYSSLNDYNSIGGVISLFNPAAGTLTGVTLTSGYNFDSSITVVAITDAIGNVSTQSAQRVFSDNAAINSLLAAALDTTSATLGPVSLNPAEFNITGTRSVFTLTAGSANTYQSSGSGMKTITLTAPNQLAAFYANANTMTAGIGFQTLTGVNFEAVGGNAFASQLTRSSDSFNVLYSYAANVPGVPSAVPEAATWAMMILGMGAIGFTMRRRKVATRVSYAA